MSDLEEIIRTMNVTKRDAIEVTAESALAAIKGAGAMTLMPAPHLPITGLLLFVHPSVYDRLREIQAEVTAAQGGE